MHFDSVQAHSGQLLMPATHFSLGAATAGLLSEEGLLTYPKDSGYTRIVLQQLRPAGLSVRLATLDDLAELAELEGGGSGTACSASEQTLRCRLSAHPTGQLVALSPDGKVLGACYSQRVVSTEELIGARYETELRAHSPAGPLVQLLDVVQRPRANVGNLLRKYLLHLSRLDATVLRVYAVARCMHQPANGCSYQAHADMGVDPGILFHTAEGAVVGKVVPDYWPKDATSRRCGVVVSYDVHSPQHAQAADSCGVAADVGQRTTSGLPASTRECESLICEVLDRLSYGGGAMGGVGEAERRRMSFMDLGLDSLDAVRLAQNLNARLEPALKLGSTVIFEHASIMELARFIHGQIQPMLPGGASPEDAPAAASTTSLNGGSPLATLSGRPSSRGDTAISFTWAGAAHTAALSLLPAGGDAVGQVPIHRWDVPPSLPAIRYGAFVAGIERFDGSFFAISPAEANAMDPQQRLLLESGYSALHEVGRRRESLYAADVGVFLGIMNADFATLHAWDADQNVYAATGGTISIAAGRVSFALGMQGPCTSYDTACSSALVAAHGASSALGEGECLMALALAASLMLSPLAHIAYARAGMMSLDGRCKTFDRQANGYARGEAVGALALSGFDASLGAGLRGSRVRSDGKSASLTAPNGTAQAQLISQALAQAGVRGLNVVQAHGTGTPLGDPTEATGLHRALGTAHVAMGSVKASIGHTEPAAGLMGLMALIWSLTHGAATVNARLRVLNTLLKRPVSDLRASVLLQDAKPTGGDAGVSSFGYSGTIAHAVIRHGDAETAAGSATTPSAFRRLTYSWRDVPHPFIKQRLAVSNASLTFRSPFAGALTTLVSDHIIQGRVIVPGAGFLEQARAACSAGSPTSGAALHGVFFLQPLAVEDAGSHVECAVADGRFEVRSGDIADDAMLADAIVHCSGGTAHDSREGLQHHVGHPMVRSLSCSLPVPVGAVYDGFHEVGLQYGPQYRTLVQAWGGSSSTAIARLQWRGSQQGTQVHPADLDDALSMSVMAVLSSPLWPAIVTATGGSQETRLPFAVDSALLHGGPGSLWAVSCSCASYLSPLSSHGLACTDTPALVLATDLQVPRGG